MRPPVDHEVFGFDLKAGQKVIGTECHVDEDKNLLFRKHFVKPGENGKAEVRLYDHPDGNGGWKAGRGPQVYRSHEPALAGSTHQRAGSLNEDQASFQLIHVGDLEYRPPEYLIEGLLETDTLGVIEYAVREHFPDLPPSSGPVSYARNYLEKLIQVPFRIPALGFAETSVYVTLLMAENALGSTDPRFLALLEAAREDMKRPWKSRGLDRKTVETAMGGTMPPDVDQALVISAHVTKILSEGTRGNPRQIKRFLNSLILRQAIAEERGFGTEVQRPVLAKIMLAERFYPDFYEQLARLAANAPDGKPDAIARFEAAIREPAPQTEDEDKPSARGRRKTTRPTQPPMPTELEEWMKNEWAKTWATIDPALSSHDLRPYVFVTRDTRSSLGGLAAASHLEALVEKLMGPTMMVRSASDQVAKLTGPEPEEVFEAIRGRILQEDSFATKPKGIDGLTKLVEMHPALQRRLLDFVRELPVPKIGAWAVSSWGTCFPDAVMSGEFETLVRGWAEQSENTTLQTTAKAVSQLSRN